MATVKLYIEPVRGGKEWTVTNRAPVLKEGDLVLWQFRLPKEYATPADLAARFQFCDDRFIKKGVTAHWTSKLPLEAGGRFEIDVRKAPQRKGSIKVYKRTFHYAVMVSGTNLDGEHPDELQFAWAYGMNPPPKVDVGG